MSYKTWKRRDQRKRSLARKAFWQEVRLAYSERAFQEWKEIYVPRIRREHQLIG